MLIPHHLNPLSLEKDIQRYTPLSRVLVTVGNYKNTPFSWFSREIFPRLRPKNTPFPEKMGTRMRPLMYSSGGRAICHGVTINYIGMTA